MEKQELPTIRYPNKSVIINRIKGYIQRITEEKIPKEELDTLFILKRLLEP